MLQKTWFVVVPTVVGGVACATIAAIYLYKKRQWFNAVSEFVQIGTVSQLNIYPVKSMKQISVEEMLCTKIGGEYKELKDRHFMLYDGNTNRMITARQLPKMITVNPNVKDNVLELTSDDNKFELSLSKVVQQKQIRRIELYDKLKQEGLDCGDEIAQYFAKIFNGSGNIRMLYFVDNLYNERDVIPQKEWLLGLVPKRCDRIAFADDAPFMAMCDSSVDDLNANLDADNRVDMRWFRPSIQISGPPAYDEDMWAELKIGDVIFTCYKPCVRCVMTTINPDTGVRRDNVEPLKTLRSYRLAPGRLRNYYKDSPVFGVDMGVICTGTIRVGDAVYARYKAHRC